MPSIDLIFAVHNHQPVGNFDFVIEEAYQKAYRPFLEALERHPRVRFSLHQPGLLWRWMEEHHPEYLAQIERMIERGQVELLGGGFYEPILPAIPEHDRQGQIALQSRYLERRFGAPPRGAWIAERVWEPQLAETLARAGLEYTVLDDSHFQSVGIPEEALDGTFFTEENGRVLQVFPISKRLRYLIPFSPPEDSLDALRERARKTDPARRPLVCFADDGEKFGSWPTTHDVCYAQGWLERFLTLLEKNEDWLRTRTFSECLDPTTSRGRVYLPTTSYVEMTVWALPPRAQKNFKRALERFPLDVEEDSELRCHVRGGFWRSFLARYPEANWLHKRMLDTSLRVLDFADRSAEDDPDVARARSLLWQGQCNCAYWHGLFGGLYLPHLRSALYTRLLRAESLVETRVPLPDADVLDLDADGLPEIRLSSEALVAIFKPAEGGALFELDDKRKCFNVLDVMTRREEAYHDTLRALAQSHKIDEPVPATSPTRTKAVSIHELVAEKEPNLVRYLVYDTSRRGSCIDHALALDTDPKKFGDGLEEIADLAGQPYDWQLDSGVLLLRRSTPLRLPDRPTLTVSKRLRLRGDVLEMQYELGLEDGLEAEFLFGVEFAVNFQAPDALDRFYEVPGHTLDDPRLGSRGVVSQVERMDVVDDWLGIRARFESETPVDIWRHPIDTISMSEGGFERVHQGSVLLLVSRLRLTRGRVWKHVLRQRLEIR